MKRLTDAKRQTLLLSLTNGVVRALGLCLRMILSRELGPEIMGIGELAGSVHMLAITPLTSGLPMAISRLTAKVDRDNQQKPLLAGIWFTRVVSAFLIPPLLLLSPLIARLMGDARVLPSLWFTAPCVMILGYSASLNGYCYGMEQSALPAGSELLEQLCRVFFCLLLIKALPCLTAPWLAAIPVAATMAAEIMGLIFVLRRVPQLPRGLRVADGWKRAVFRLAAPATLTRLMQTGLRSLTAILIPLRLQASGLAAAEATARLGMLNGMAMPLLMLPCIFTSALSMVSMPKLAKAENQPKTLKRLLWQCAGACLSVGALCSALLWLAAPFISSRIYRQAELTALLRFCAPLTAVIAVSHFSGGVLTALGRQKQAMYGATLSAGLSLGLTWLLAARPHLRLQGVAWAHYAANAASLLWNAGVLLKGFTGDKSGPFPPSPGRPGDTPPAASATKGRVWRFS